MRNVASARFRIDLDEWPLSLALFPIVDHNQGLVNSFRQIPVLEYGPHGELAPGICEPWLDRGGGLLRLKVRPDTFWPDGDRVRAEEIRQHIARLLYREGGSIPGAEILGVADRCADRRGSHFGLQAVGDEVLEISLGACKSVFEHLLTMPEFAPRRARGTIEMGTGPYLLAWASREAGLIRLTNTLSTARKGGHLPPGIDLCLYERRDQAIADLRRDRLDVSIHTGLSPTALQQATGVNITGRAIGVVGHLVINPCSDTGLGSSARRRGLRDEMAGIAFEHESQGTVRRFRGYRHVGSDRPAVYSGGAEESLANSLDDRGSQTSRHRTAAKALRLVYAAYPPNHLICLIIANLVEGTVGRPVALAGLRHSHFAKAAGARDFDLLYGLNPAAYLHPSSYLGSFHSTQSWARMCGFSSPGYDLLVEKAVEAGSAGDAELAWADVEQDFMTKLPVIPVTQVYAAAFTREDRSPVMLTCRGYPDIVSARL